MNDDYFKKRIVPFRNIMLKIYLCLIPTSFNKKGNSSEVYSDIDVLLLSDFVRKYGKNSIVKYRLQTVPIISLDEEMRINRQILGHVVSENNSSDRFFALYVPDYSLFNPDPCDILAIVNRDEPISDGKLIILKLYCTNEVIIGKMILFDGSIFVEIPSSISRLQSPLKLIGDKDQIIGVVSSVRMNFNLYRKDPAGALYLGI